MENDTIKGFESKKTKKKKVFVMTIQIISIVIISAVAVFAGWFVVGDLVIGRLDTFDPTQYTASEYEEDPNNIALWAKKNIGELNATQIFLVAQSKILTCDYYGVYTKGYNGEEKGYVSTLGMNQDLYGYRYRNNTAGYFDYFSTGLAKVVKKVEYTFGEDKYYCYEGKETGSEVVWTPFLTESGSAYRTGAEYKEMVGCEAENPIDYIVSTKTVSSQTNNGKVGSVYSFTLNLDPSTSVLYYVKKMKYMSGFDYPKFSNIELRFEVDEDMNFQNIYISESYRVIGMPAESKYKMEFVYENVEIR